MPTMPRPKGKCKDIADSIMGKKSKKKKKNKSKK